MNSLKAVIIFVMMLFSSPAYCDDDSKVPKDSNYLMAFLLGEGLLSLNAYGASKSPGGYGTIGVLFFPLAAAESNSNNITTWVMLGSAEAIALYNLNIDKDKKSESEIFKNNMIAWHAFIGISLLTGYLTGDFKEKEKAGSVAYIPQSGGGTLLLSYRF